MRIWLKDTLTKITEIPKKHLKMLSKSEMDTFS